MNIPQFSAEKSLYKSFINPKSRRLFTSPKEEKVVPSYWACAGWWGKANLGHDFWWAAIVCAWAQGIAFAWVPDQIPIWSLDDLGPFELWRF